MKTIVECKRALMYNTMENKVVAILHEQYNPTLSDRDILCVLYSPYTMEWGIDNTLWIRDSHIRIEVFCEYKEIETLWDKLKRWGVKIIWNA